MPSRNTSSPRESLQHSNKRIALLIGDVVERAVRFSFSLDRLLNRMGGGTGITFHGRFLPIPTRRVGSRDTFLSSQTSHCGLKCAVHLLPIQEANPSFSQRLSHHAIVTRSPNHCAPFRARSLHKCLAWSRRKKSCRIEEQPRFVVGDAAPVFHRPAESARDGDLIEFRQRIGDAEVIVVVLQNLR